MSGADLGVGVSTRQQLASINGVIETPPCACGLEVDSDGDFFVTHDPYCPVVELRMVRAYLLRAIGPVGDTMTTLQIAMEIRALLVAK